MGVYDDGVMVRTVPVSMGQHRNLDHPQRHQNHYVHRRTVGMDSATVGITGSGSYDETVPYAMRLTWSGEYIHGAPWSVYAQGSYDVSHGCVNVSLDQRLWLYATSLVGRCRLHHRHRPPHGMGRQRHGWRLERSLGYVDERGRLGL